MAVKLDDRVRRLLEAPNLAVIATLDRSGTPCVQPVWVDAEGDTVCLSSIEGRWWPERVRRDGRISLSIVNAEAMTEYAELRGHVIEDTHEGADEHIDRLSRKYLGIDYPNRFEGEQRITFRVEVDKVNYVNLLEAIPGAPFGDQR